MEKSLEKKKMKKQSTMENVFRKFNAHKIGKRQIINSKKNIYDSQENMIIRTN